MDMSWQAMLHDAAAVSFEGNVESLATENRTLSYVDLSHAQIQTLSEKILSAYRLNSATAPKTESIRFIGH